MQNKIYLRNVYLKEQFTSKFWKTFCGYFLTFMPFETCLTFFGTNGDVLKNVQLLFSEL